MFQKLALTFLIILSHSAGAEYRVYQYVVKARNPFSIDQKSFMVTSTLDPQSYLAYHGGRSTLMIDLIRTWMCKGNTSRQEYCESPYSQMQRELSEEQKGINRDTASQPPTSEGA